MSRSILMKLIGFLLISTLLGGCATVLAPIASSLLAHVPVPIWSAHSNNSEHTITWLSQLPGKSPYKGPPFGSANVIDEGVYSSWHWIVTGSEAVQQSYQAWSEAHKLAGMGSETVHDWESGMRQLHRLTTYLLSTAPRPIYIKVVLIPKGQQFSIRTKEQVGATTALTLAAPFVITQSTEQSANQERFADLREAIAMVGSQLQHLELATGVTSAPSTGRPRIIKDAANSFCWRLAARPALAAYTDSELKIKGAGSNLQMTIAVLAASYKEHPDDQVALALYSAALTVEGADRYLRYRGLDWPKTGHDLDGINALLEYCRAFIHYTGDITKQQIPLSDIQPIPFFPGSR